MTLYMENSVNALIYWAKRIYRAGMTPATSGNISIKKDGEIYISKSGVCLGDIEADEIATVNLEGDLINGVKPSSEKVMHLEIYKQREDINAIIHIHCPYITAFALCHKAMEQPYLPEFILNFDKIPLAKYALPSSIELAYEVGNYFNAGSNAVLMENHGIVCGGKSLKSTFYALESIQAYAKTYIFSTLLGEAKKLNQNEIEKIKQLKG